MSAEQEAQKRLSKLDITGIKFTGREPYKGKERLLYTYRDGAPVMDAPIVIVDQQDSIELRPWTDMLR